MIRNIFNALCITTLTLSNAHASLNETSDYFNTSFLIHYDQVSKSLIKDGFNEVLFPSEDNLWLNGLWLKRNQASCNVILCAGFYPGRKEGLAAFYHLLPPDCNILMFDARGHGASEGSFFCKLHLYGTHEYKDIIGALRFIREKNNKPIFLLGMCAGAYHCIKAVHHIQNNELPAPLPAGMILDSSILSLADAIEIPKKYFLHNVLPNLLRIKLYPNSSKTAVKESWTYMLCSWLTAPVLTALEYFFHPCTLLRSDSLDLSHHCNEIKTPIFFIHAQNDTLAPCSLIQKCSDAAFRTWWPKKAVHACIYLQHKHTYQAHLDAFIRDILATS